MCEHSTRAHPRALEGTCVNEGAWIWKDAYRIGESAFKCISIQTD